MFAKREKNGKNFEVGKGILHFGCRLYKEKNEEFKSLLDGIHQGLGNDLEQLFNGWWKNIKYNIYVSCFSEHNDDEDELGRLSMWREEISGFALLIA